jgi:transposase
MTILDVPRPLNVEWDLIKKIQKRGLSRHYAKSKLKHLRYIAIHEIAVAKGRGARVAGAGRPGWSYAQ